jgi:hypothetical protein
MGHGQDVLLAAGPGYSGLGVDPDSMESIRGANGVYRVKISGTSKSPVMYSAGGAAVADSGVAELPPVIITGSRMTDAERAAYDAEQAQALLQVQNDAQVAAGIYNKFGAAWDSALGGNWSQAWFHLNYTPSTTARQAVYDRVFPQPDSRFARIDAIRSSGIAGVAVVAGQALGASNRTLDALAHGGSALEGVLGGAGGWKTLTLAPPPPNSQAARVRGIGGAGRVFSKDAPYVIRYDPSFPGRPDPQYSVDSLTFKAPAGYNARGYPRDAGGFWRNWVEQNPDSLSPSNKYLIDNYDRLKVSPRVDQTWIDAFPEHGNYMGDVLIHHHVDFGQYTIPVPGKTHVGSGGPWHK